MGTKAPATGPTMSEAGLLLQARQALAASPAQALAHCNEHQRHYARGALVQEREVIVIEALTRLGRRDEAAERLRRFVQAYPSSAYRPRLEALVGP
jgi:hypothetical protein